MAATPAAVLASGGAATTAGFYTSTGTEPAADIDAWINYALDKAAAATNTVLPVAKGGTGGTDAASARVGIGINLGTADAAAPNKVPVYNGAAQLTTADPTLGGHAASKQYVDAATAGRASLADVQYVQQGNMTTDVYNRTLSGSYRVCYVGADGRLGWVPSSRRYKKNIRPAEVDPAAVLDLDLVTFLYKAAIDTERLAETQHGLIAEDVDALGLTWLVDYGPDGQPEGVRYDRLALALLPALQHLAGRVVAIETHLDALGGDLDAAAAE